MAENISLLLLNSLWQGGLIYFWLQMVLKTVSIERPQLRYFMSLSASVGLIVCSLFTWSWLSLEPSLSSNRVFEHAPVEYSSRHAMNSDSITSSTPDPHSEFQTRIAESHEPNISESMEEWTGIQTLSSFWLLGVIIMMVRVIRDLMLTAHLRSQSIAESDSCLQKMMDRLVASMYIANSVTVRISETIQSPAVIGFIKPVILFPALIVTRLPQEQLEAILAHELAHIRRHDFLINMIQRFIEAMFYFNPFVWFIHRQIRIEREACCDAMAVNMTGKKDSYADALISVTEIIVPDAIFSESAVAFADSDKPSGILDRFKRILIPGYQPKQGLRFPSIIAALMITSLALAALYQGSHEVAELAARILTDRERMDIIHAELDKNPMRNPNQGNEDSEKVTMSGTVRLADGSIPEDLKSIFFSTMSRSYSRQENTAQYIASDGAFEFSHTFDTILIWATSTNYAPVHLGPYTLEQAKALGDIEIILNKGFDGLVQVIDKTGTPIKNATIAYRFNAKVIGSYIPRQSNSEKEGLAVIPNVSEDFPLDLTIEADGFEKLTQEGVIFKPENRHQVQLVSTTPVSILVVSAETGKAIPNAALHLLAETRRGNSNAALYTSGPNRAPVKASSDSNGIIHLTKLNSNRIYYYLLRAEGYHPIFVPEVRVGQETLTVALDAPMVIQGRIIGSLKNIRRRGGRQNPSVMCQYSWVLGNSGYSDQMYVDVTPTAEGGTFEIRTVPSGIAGKLSLSIGNRQKRIDISEPIEEVVFNFEEPEFEFPLRTVNISFNLPAKDSPVPEGTLHLRPMKHIPDNHYGMPDPVEIMDGMASVQVEVPGKLMIEPYGLIGYFMKLPKLGEFEIPAGNGPFGIRIDTDRAGGIICKVDTPSTLIKNVTRLQVIPNDANKLRLSGFHINDFGNYFGNLETSHVTLTPLPLGMEYRIVYSNEYYYGITDPIRLTPEEPLPNIDIRIGEGIPIRGKILYPEGTPAVEVPIHLSYLPPISHSFGAIDIYTDSEGRFDFPNVNPDASGKYSLSIRLEEDFQPYRIDIKHPWYEMNIKLETGLESRGRILDARTGKPVTGAKITAHDFQYHYMSETTTDADGVFHFTTLNKSEYRLFASQLNWASREDPRITGGQSAVATFKVNIPEWSKHFSAIE